MSLRNACLRVLENSCNREELDSSVNWEIKSTASGKCSIEVRSREGESNTGRGVRSSYRRIPRL